MRLTAITLMLLGALCSSSGRAAFPEAAAYEEALEPVAEAAELESQWAEELAPGDPFEDELATASDGAEEGLLCGDAVDCGDWIDPAPSLRRRWTVLTELTVLVPSYSDSTYEAKHRAFVGPRLTLGWESANGFGIRGRGWGFDGATEAERSSLPSAVTTHELLFSGNRLDLDFYKRIKHNTGDFAFGAGLTAARLTLRERFAVVQTSRLYGYYYYYEPFYYYDYYSIYSFSNYGAASPGLARLQSSVTSYENGVTTRTYQGNGLVRNTGGGLGLMMEGTHRFYETPLHVWSLFGRGRLAYLVGEWEAPNTLDREDGDANMAIGEAALGVEYKRRFRRADVSLLCAFEMQSWDVSILDRVTLAGVTAGLGVNW